MSEREAGYINGIAWAALFLIERNGDQTTAGALCHNEDVTVDAMRAAGVEDDTVEALESVIAAAFIAAAFRASARP